MSYSGFDETNNNDERRKVDKRKSIEKRWRKGQARWQYSGDGESDDDFIAKKRSSPRKYQIAKPENEREALVIQTGGPRVVILDHELEFQAKPRRSTTSANPNSSLIAIGDKVRYIDAGEGEAVITHVFPRATALSRTSVESRDFEQVIVANIDLVVVVGAAQYELLRPGLIDRYLIAAAMGGLAPLIVINKLDLVDDEDFATVEEIASAYRNAGYDLLYTSCITGEGINELANLLTDKISAFVGHSGVGKTSLLNRLVPEAQAKIQDLSEQSRRGIHTTTTSALYELPNGGYVADTPGIREFGLFFFDKKDLYTYYPEFLPFADQCRYPSCTHIHEPDCAVIQAVENGMIPLLRYRNYAQILESEIEE